MADAYRVLVTGSRTWDAEGSLRQVLISIASDHPGLIVVHGANPGGADAMADRWARDYGFPVERHPADWNAPCRPECGRGHRRSKGPGREYCPAAGNYRNQEMVDTGPDACLPFFQPGAANRGTSDCVRRAVAAGIPVEPRGQVPQSITRLLDCGTTT